MAFINVAEWAPGNVADWLRGLDDSVLPYVQFFLNNNVNGCRLLLLTCDDLENLNVKKIGHQEIILEGVDLLKHLHYNFASETLQSQALRLGCRARSLYNQLKSDEKHNLVNQNRVSTSTLSSVSDILLSVKSFISWIDRYPFSAQDTYIPVRGSVLRRSIELASTAQRDQFVEKPNDVLKESCFSLADLCEKIVQELNDSLAITPAFLEVVGIKKKPEEDLGLQIFSSYCGVHLVGGIQKPSPSSRCLRIEDGDEIVQIKYQTVVGWQLKNLVNAMKDSPTEILLTLKKRPRHSPYAGQAVVTKAQKLRRPHSRTQVNRFQVKEEPETAESEEENFEASYKQTQLKGPVHQVPPQKPKLPLRRRATISGGSPTTLQPPFRLEDLIPKAKKDHLNRSISHDVSNAHNPGNKLPSRPLNAVVQQVPLLPIKTSSISSTSSQVPHARVQPLPATNPRPPKLLPSETVPKQVMGQLPIYDQVPFEINEETKKTRPGQTVGIVIPNHTSRETRHEVIADGEKKMRDSPPPLPSRSSSAVKKLKEKASRRIPFKALGIIDYQGWLLQRKEVQGYLVPTNRWTKRWVVLKQNLLFCFKTPDSVKADCLISLPGFVVAAASDGKPRKYSFRVYNLTTAFYFASDSVSDMSKWISKIGFAAISYSSTFQSVDEAFFSETDSSDQEADYINDHEESMISAPRLPSRQVLRNNSTASAASNASSIQVPTVAPVRVPDRRVAKPVPAPVVRSNSSVDASTLPSRNRKPLTSNEYPSCKQETYVKLAYPPPSPRGRRAIPPPSPESPRKYVELAPMDESVVEKPPLPEKPGKDALKVRREPPTPQPRVSKLKEKFEKTPETVPPPKPRVMAAEPKTVDQMLNSSDSLLNPVYNHVIPKDQGTRLAVAVDPDIFSKTPSPDGSGFMSILDREYNRLFGDKSPLELNKCVPPRTSTDVVANIYGITTSPPVRQEPVTSSTLPRTTPKCGPYVGKMNRSHSPISDNSCSSSSGISSTLSMSVESSSNRLEVPPRNEIVVDDVFASQELDTNAKSKKAVKSNSFRMLSSPKLLKKLSTPKYHKGRRQEKKDVKSPDDFRGTSGFFKVSRLSSNDASKGLRRSNSINRSSSDTSMTSPFPVRSHSAERLRLPTRCRVSCEADLSDQPASPEAQRKPTMGVAMIKKRRASNVSSDRSAIEVALSNFPGTSPGNEQRSCNSPDTEEEWSNIVRSLEKVGIPLNVSFKSSEQLADEEVCHLVLSLRSFQKSLKDDRRKEREAIDDLLKEPITLHKLQNWIRVHPTILS